MYDNKANTMQANPLFSRTPVVRGLDYKIEHQEKQAMVVKTKQTKRKAIVNILTIPRSNRKRKFQKKTQTRT